MRRLTIGDRLIYRLQAAIVTRSQRRDWHYALILLALFSLIYLPVGFHTGFLRWDWRLNPGLVLRVAVGALFSPGIVEELIFRVLMLPHPTEPLPPLQRQIWWLVSWSAFLLYHLPPWTPSWFKTPMFLLGAGLVGLVCSFAYLQSRSIYTAIALHWVIVVVWLIGFGGWARFEQS
jgi:uncharacterized protein